MTWNASRSRFLRSHPSILLFSATLALLCITLLFGCSADQRTFAPEWRPESTVRETAPGAPNPDMLEETLGLDIPKFDPDAPETLTEKKVIDRENGGSVALEEITVDFPPMSLEEDTEITILTQDRPGDRVVFDLLPHGIKFDKPVTLTVDLSGTGIGPEEDATIYWFDPEARDWVDLEANWQWPIASIQLDHFSRYGSGRAGWTKGPKIGNVPGTVREK
jgi:hypothetical protein